MGVPAPGQYRLEYLTTAGWVKGHGDLALMDPERYVAKMASRLDDDKAGEGAWARCLEIDERLQPTGVVFEPPGLPPFEEAPPSRLRNGRVSECAACGDPHEKAWGCLL
jgi:hypothetical protein